MGARGLVGHGMPSKFCSHFFALAISFVPGLLFSENYPYGEVIKTHGGGVGPGSFWIYEPAAPKPQKAPVVFFLPGYSAVNPINYGAWFDHLVRSGHMVVYLSYMLPGDRNDDAMSRKAFESVKRAIAELEHNSHVHPDWSQFSIIGHSLGGIIAANLAVLMEESKGMPVPQLIFPTEPGKTALSWYHPKRIFIHFEDFRKLPEHTLMVTSDGDKDYLYGAHGKESLSILACAPQIPPQNRLFYWFRSSPGQRATHFLASAPDPFYDDGQPAGLAGKNANGVWQHLQRQILGKMIVDGLDQELWRLFDEAAAVRFHGSPWTMPIMDYDQLNPRLRQKAEANCPSIYLAPSVP